LFSNLETTFVAIKLGLRPPLPLQIFPENTGLKLQRRAYLVWDDDGPQRVLLVKKIGDLAASTMLQEIGVW